MYPDKPVLDVSALYWRLKDSVAKYELIVLRVNNFELNHELPHKVKNNMYIEWTLYNCVLHVLCCTILWLENQPIIILINF